MEGSNDKDKLALIDEQFNGNCITKNHPEVYFSAQAKESFSFFKLTQTGKNTLGPIILACVTLNFLRLF
jgi:hypothetical protein